MRQDHLHKAERIALPLVLVAVVEDCLRVADLVREPCNLAAHDTLGIGVPKINQLRWRFGRRVASLLVASKEPD